MTGHRPEGARLPVVLVAGMHADARTEVVDRLLAEVPGSVAVHHDLSTAAHGTVRRTVRDAAGDRLPCLANGADVGLAAAASDRRTVGDTWARQLEYPPVLVPIDSPVADDEDRARSWPNCVRPHIKCDRTGVSAYVGPAPSSRPDIGAYTCVQVRAVSWSSPPAPAPCRSSSTRPGSPRAVSRANRPAVAAS